MRTAKISELKAKLSAHLRYVKNGEEVLILDRNIPIARLVPAAATDDDDERMRRLIARGVVTPPKTPRPEGYALPEPPGPMISQELMDQIWEEERADRC